MKLWLDDIRPPWKYGCIGWRWAQTAEEAIHLLETGTVTEASLDHDLAPDHYSANDTELAMKTGTGYDVVRWMETNNMWPKNGVAVHSMNPAGRQRMRAAIQPHYPDANIIRLLL